MKVKKFICVCVFAFASFILGSSYAKNHENNNECVLTIINHYDKTLHFTVGLNPNTLPDLPVNFNLEKNAEIKSKVLKEKEAYIRAEDTDGHSGFFGVNIENNQVKIHGYLSHGIAFSWTAGTITFCTPDEYKKNKHC